MTAAPHAPPLSRTTGFPVITPGLRIVDTRPAAVLRVARREGPIFRDAAAARTGLSAPTLNRHVVALIEAGLLRERTDLAPSGAVGRPRLPFDLRGERHLTVGVHIGYRTTTITTHDLRGRTLDGLRVATSHGTATEVLRSIGARARRFLERWPGRHPLSAGVAVGGRVDAHGRVDHPRLGWDAAEVGALIGAEIGLPISVAPHVESMAAAELAFGPTSDPHASTLYCYARETIGVALTIGGAVHNPRTGPGTIGHLPAGPTQLLDPHETGRLDDAVSDSGILEAARVSGVPADSTSTLASLANSGNQLALALLRERAQVLGRAIGHIADVVNPDRIVVGGQAFVDFSSAMPDVARAVTENSAGPERELRITAAGNRVQQQAAAAVSLDAVYADPLAALRRATADVPARERTRGR